MFTGTSWATPQHSAAPQYAVVSQRFISSLRLILYSDTGIRVPPQPHMGVA
jgi:hypothetical protein